MGVSRGRSGERAAGRRALRGAAVSISAIYEGAVRHDPGALTGSSPKQLHVSPFMGMDYKYDWRVSAPARALEVHIETRRSGQLAFDATMCLRRRELTPATLRRTALRYPFATVRV